MNNTKYQSESVNYVIYTNMIYTAIIYIHTKYN